jgi:hypothetical protein
MIEFFNGRENKENLRYGKCIGIASIYKIDNVKRLLCYHPESWLSPWRGDNIEKYNPDDSLVNFQIVHPDGLYVERDIRIGDRVCLILEENQLHISGSTIIKRLEFNRRNEPRNELTWTIHDRKGKLSTD